MENIEIRKEKKKEYIRLWKKSHPERVRETTKKWKLKNKDSIKKWKLKNKDKIAVYAKEYRMRHPESIRLSRKRYNERHKDVLRMKRRLYRVKNRVIKPPRIRLTTQEREFNERLNKYKRNARIRNYDFLLSSEDFRQLLDTPCYYCGGAGGGVDRVDNSIGYVLDNVVACCRACNWTKRILSKQAFIKICIAVAKRHEPSPEPM
jgi:hypothetical protein